MGTAAVTTAGTAVVVAGLDRFGGVVHVLGMVAIHPHVRVHGMLPVRNHCRRCRLAALAMFRVHDRSHRGCRHAEQEPQNERQAKQGHMCMFASGRNYGNWAPPEAALCQPFPLWRLQGVQCAHSLVGQCPMSNDRCSSQCARIPVSPSSGTLWVALVVCRDVCGGVWGGSASRVGVSAGGGVNLPDDAANCCCPFPI